MLQRKRKQLRGMGILMVMVLCRCVYVHACVYVCLKLFLIELAEKVSWWDTIWVDTKGNSGANYEALEKGFPEEENCAYEGLEEWLCLICSRNSRATRVVRREWSKGLQRRWGLKVTSRAEGRKIMFRYLSPL